MFYTLREEIKFEYRMAQEQDGEPAGLLTWVRSAIGQIAYVLRYEYCERKGHRWDETYADAENGGELLICGRCGNSTTHYF